MSYDKLAYKVIFISYLESERNMEIDPTMAAVGKGRHIAAPLAKTPMYANKEKNNVGPVERNLRTTGLNAVDTILEQTL